MSVLFLQLKIDHIFSILKKYFIFFSDGDVDVCHSIKSSSWSSNNFNQPRVVNLCPHLYSPFDLHTGKIIIIIYFQKNDDVNKSCLQQHYFKKKPRWLFTFLLSFSCSQLGGGGKQSVFVALPLQSIVFLSSGAGQKKFELWRSTTSFSSIIWRPRDFRIYNTNKH